MSEPARKDFTPEWGDFVEEFIQALYDDETVAVAISAFQQFEHYEIRERWAMTLWSASLYACGNAYQSLSKKVPPL